MKNIINFDETYLLLDGSQDVRGGQPEVVFFDPNLPNFGKGTSKSSKTTTMITASNAAGEALSLYFQFQTDTKTEEGQRVINEMMEWMLNVRGKFGGDAEMPWPCTFDVPGQRLMANVDSGPGRMCAELLAALQLLGVYLYPGVPNTRAVSHRPELRSLQDPVPQELGHDCPNTNPESSLCVSRALAGGPCRFRRGRSQDKGGHSDRGQRVRKGVFCRCVPQRMAEDRGCTTDQEEDNHISVQILDCAGYQVDLLKATIKEVSKPKHVMVPHSKECIVLLAKAKTHSAKFTATGGGHLTSDDYFKSMEVKTLEAEIKLMAKDKEVHQLKTKAERDAWAVIMQTKSCNEYKEKDLVPLLTRYDVPR
ncbi:hypothetical protein ACHAWF_016321 [Thalassiosira exigua]